MTEKRFKHHMGLICEKRDEEYYSFTIKEVCNLLNAFHEENKALKKEIHLMHIRSMFSTVKSFKGDISTRYKYDEKTDTIYDTANHYGQYDKILDKKEITMLLNEYNTLLGDME